MDNIKTHGNNSVSAIWTENGISTYGLTKREYFAAMALQGLCARSTGKYEECDSVAKLAVDAADALIEELNK